MGRTWIPEALRHPRATMRRQFEKLRELMAGESSQTRDMLDVYRRSLEGHSTRDERKQANAQFVDLLRIAGLGAFFVVVPGSVLIIPIMVKAASKVGVRLLPDTFETQAPIPTFDDASGYLQWWTQRQDARTEPVTVVIGQTTIELDPGVFNPCPTETASTELLLDQLLDVEGRTMLDMGCGAGVLGIHTGLADAEAVISVDIDAKAIANTRRNIDTHDLQGVVVAEQGDLFETLGEQRFDLITANLPIAKSAWPFGCADVLDRFIEHAPEHLCPGGRALLVWASFGDVDAVPPQLDEHGWTRVVTIERFGQSWWVEQFVSEV